MQIVSNPISVIFGTGSFDMFQAKPNGNFLTIGKVRKWVRWSASRYHIFMLDKRKDTSSKGVKLSKHDGHSMKQKLSKSLSKFDEWCNLGTVQNAPRERVMEESLSTRPLTNKDESSEDFINKSERGTIRGAISLITGTSIGSGILALPASTAPAGFIPTAVSMIICWGFLVFEALLLAEVNVFLLKQRDTSHAQKGKSEVISLCSMAEQTLGKWGGILSRIGYILLTYTILVAYVAKSGEVLSFLVNMPAPIAGILFMCIFGILVFVGGANVTDKVNQLLTACLMGLFFLILALTPLLGSWSGLNHMNWDMVPNTIPVILFSLVYHDLTPVLCAYLGGDMSRIRISIIVGSIIPLASFLIWDAAILGLTPTLSSGDPLEFLIRLGGTNVSYLVQVFSLLAVATSLIGTLLGFSEFFLEQLSNSTKIMAEEGGNIRIIPLSTLYTKTKQFFVSLPPINGVIASWVYRPCSWRSFTSFIDGSYKMASLLDNWWIDNGLNLASFVLVIVPPLLVSTMVTDAFFTATDIAGAYGMTTLYGIFPPAMAWTLIKSENKLLSAESTPLVDLGKKFALAGIGLCACGVVLNQLLLDSAKIPFVSMEDISAITEINNSISAL